MTRDCPVGSVLLGTTETPLLELPANSVQLGSTVQWEQGMETQILVQLEPTVRSALTIQPTVLRDTEVRNSERKATTTVMAARQGRTVTLRLPLIVNLVEAPPTPPETAPYVLV